MEPLTDEERRAFLEIYSYKDEVAPVDEPVIESLIRRGLLERQSDSEFALTDRGNALYESLRPDEPYEGV